MQDLRIGLVQTSQFWEDKQANLNHFESLLSNNFNSPVDLLVLPEMFNTSFSMNVKSLAETQEGPSIKWMISQANRFNCQIAASLIIEENGSFYNRMIIASASGIENQYDKRHLFRMAKENDYFEPGSDRVVHQIKGWNILLQICYDLRFPVFSRNKRIGNEKEYDLSLYIANWPEKRNEIWKTLLKARAIENQSFCVGLNRIGEDGNGISYSGDSLVVDPWGNVQDRFEAKREVVKIVTLKKDLLDDITQRFPAYLDADDH